MANTEKKKKTNTIDLEKLAGYVTKKPSTAKALAAIYKRTPVAIKRALEQIPGVKSAKAAPTGARGRPALVYSIGAERSPLRSRRRCPAG